MATRNLVIDKTFVLGKKLGQGGMGTVYRAVHRMSGKVVAVKVLRGTEATLEPSNSSLNPRLALTREFQILSSLHHPNIVKVLDYGFDEVEGPYVVMELLTHAQTILEAAAPRTQRERVLLFAQLLLALAYLHHRQIVHRDLKPSNVLFSKDTIKVLDFGLASPAAQSAALAGTFDYVAPELWLGQSPTVGSDLYACGVIACQLLTGQLPERRYPALSDGPSSALTRTGSALQTPGDGMEITSGPGVGG
jgi:serine/threonine protein kinase